MSIRNLGPLKSCALQEPLGKARRVRRQNAPINWQRAEQLRGCEPVKVGCDCAKSRKCLSHSVLESKMQLAVSQILTINTRIRPQQRLNSLRIGSLCGLESTMCKRIPS